MTIAILQIGPETIDDVVQRRMWSVLEPRLVVLTGRQGTLLSLPLLSCQSRHRRTPSGPWALAA